jgi:hypothetical protein
MSQNEDQKDEAMEKVSELGEQLDIGGEDVSNAFDRLRNGDLEVRTVASFGETFGRQGGALLGRRAGEAIGRTFADEDGTLSLSSITSTLRRSGGEEDGKGEDGAESENSEGEDGSESGDGDGDETDSENGPESKEEIEIEGDGSGSFEDMSNEKLQTLANDLMDELEQRQSSES